MWHFNVRISPSALSPTPAFDIPYSRNADLSYFEDDDVKLKQVEESYRKGDLLTGELKKGAITLLQEYVREFQERRKTVTDEVLESYMALRKLEWKGNPNPVPRPKPEPEESGKGAKEATKEGKKAAKEAKKKAKVFETHQAEESRRVNEAKSLYGDLAAGGDSRASQSPSQPQSLPVREGTQAD